MSDPAPPSSEHYELSETKKHDLIKHIKQGKPLPEECRFPLLDDKREVEKGQLRFHDVAYIEVTPCFGRADGPLPAAERALPMMRPPSP